MASTFFRRQASLRFRIGKCDTGIVKRNNRLTPCCLPLLHARKCIFCAAESLHSAFASSCEAFSLVVLSCTAPPPSAGFCHMTKQAISIRRPRSTCTYGKKQCNNCFSYSSLITLFTSAVVIIKQKNSMIYAFQTTLSCSDGLKVV